MCIECTVYFVTGLCLIQFLLIHSIHGHVSLLLHGRGGQQVLHVCCRLIKLRETCKKIPPGCIFFARLVKVKKRVMTTAVKTTVYSSFVEKLYGEDATILHHKCQLQVNSSYFFAPATGRVNSVANKPEEYH